MASDNFKIESFKNSGWKKYVDSDLECSKKGHESVMKFSFKKLDSPPPKPPRRRYSDQLSLSSSGTYSSSKKHNEASLVANSKLKNSSPEPAYLSLPADLTSNILPESNDSPISLSHTPSLSDHFKCFKENHLKAKTLSSQSKFSENEMNFLYGNKEINCTVKHKYQENVTDFMVLKLYNENSHPHPLGKLSTSIPSTNEVFLTGKNVNRDSTMSVSKDCHRRHHSDPVVSHFKLQNDIYTAKLDHEQYINICSLRKANNWEVTDTCACCKKSYLILQEIRFLKEINEKLWQHICSLQSQVENLSRAKYDESEISLSGLLSSIYYAQKARDCAMEERLKIALEERNSALLDLDDLVKFMTKSSDCKDEKIEVEKDVLKLLNEMRCTLNPSQLLRCQRMILTEIHNSRESKQDSVSQDLKHAIIEKEIALEKVKKLEEDVRDLKLTYDLWHSDSKHWESTIFDILNQILYQRDAVLSRVENGLDIGNIIYRPPLSNKLDSLDYQKASSFESCSKTIETIKNHQSIHLSDYKTKHSFGASDEVMKLKEDVMLLSKSLENEMKKREHAEGKCIRLERLVHILRKKLNGQNVGVPV